MTILFARRHAHRLWPVRITSVASALLLLAHPASVAASGATPAPDTARPPTAHDTGPAPSSPTAAPTVDLSDPVIRKAIADSHDVMDDIVPAAPAAFGNRPMTPQQRVDRAFEEADIPSCLTPDAFKFVPPSIGPFEVSGLLALPFWAHAIATGKCRR